MVEYERKLYSTHKFHVQPCFEKISIPLSLKEDQLNNDHPVYTRRIAILDILNLVFVATADVLKKSFDFDISGESFSISIGQRETFDIDSDSVCLTDNNVQ